MNGANKTHLRDIRLHNNAGMSLPMCIANESLLDVDCDWPITLDKHAVTCDNCKDAAMIRYSWVHWPWIKTQKDVKNAS